MSMCKCGGIQLLAVVFLTPVFLSIKQPPPAIFLARYLSLLLCSLLAFELQRPHMDPIETQLYRTVRQTRKQPPNVGRLVLISCAKSTTPPTLSL